MAKQRSKTRNRPFKKVSRSRHTNGATPKAPKKIKLSKVQTMAVQLMSARERLKERNVLIAKARIREGNKAAADSKRISELEIENADLTDQLMGAWNRAEEAENTLLCKEQGLPVGTVNYTKDEDGLFSYEAKDGEIAPRRPAPAVEEDLDDSEVDLNDEGEDEDDAQEAEEPTAAEAPTAP